MSDARQIIAAVDALRELSASVDKVNRFLDQRYIERDVILNTIANLETERDALDADLVRAFAALKAML